MTGKLTKALTIGTALLAMTACSTMKEIEVRETKANPNWYQDCEQIVLRLVVGKQIMLIPVWVKANLNKHLIQAYAFAVKGFAERINGVVNSNTTVDIRGNNGVESRVTQTIVKHSTKNTSITEHVEVEKHAYELASTGRVHTYVRIKMPLQVFDKLLAEAKDDRNAKRVSAIKHTNN